MKLHIILALLLLGTSSVAYAGDSKSYPASACKYYGPQESDEFFEIDLAGAITNTGSESAHVVCPIVNDYMWYWEDDLLRPTVVEYAEAHAKGGVTCRIYDTHSDGTLPHSSPPDEVVGYGPNYVYQAMFWGVGSNEIPKADYGALALYCNIPVGSTLYSYNITEGEFL